MIELHVHFQSGVWGVSIRERGKMDRFVTYPAWDKRVALSYAKAEAKNYRPARVVVHDKAGAIQNKLDFE
jgi:hypothetical protein